MCKHLILLEIFQLISPRCVEQNSMSRFDERWYLSVVRLCANMERGRLRGYGQSCSKVEILSADEPFIYGGRDVCCVDVGKIRDCIYVRIAVTHCDAI